MYISESVLITICKFLSPILSGGFLTHKLKVKRTVLFCDTLLTFRNDLSFSAL